jgi:hypothetical protein
MRGSGSYADLIAQRFRIAYGRLGFEGHAALSHGLFRVPEEPGGQLGLF